MTNEPDFLTDMDTACVVTCQDCDAEILRVRSVLRTQTLVEEARAAHTCVPLPVLMQQWLAAYDAGEALNAQLILIIIRKRLAQRS